MKVVSSDCCPLAQVETTGERCPRCAAKGKVVSLATVGSMVKTGVAPEKLSRATYWLCPKPDCPVVYFAPGIIIEKSELRVSVNFKEQNYEGRVCYCFNHTVASIKTEIQSKGYSTAPEMITREVKAGRCACEVKNPAGTCCLGDVTRTVHAATVQLNVASDLRPEQ